MAQITAQIAQIFCWVNGSKPLNTLDQKNLRNLQVNLRHLREIKIGINQLPRSNSENRIPAIF